MWIRPSAGGDTQVWDLAEISQEEETIIKLTAHQPPNFTTLQFPETFSSVVHPVFLGKVSEKCILFDQPGRKRVKISQKYQGFQYQKLVFGDIWSLCEPFQKTRITEVNPFGEADRIKEIFWHHPSD